MERKKIISLGSLVLGNIYLGVLLVTDRISLLTVVWAFWIQSIVIGVSTFSRIVKLKEDELQNRFGFPTSFVKVASAFFFVLQYGGFHLVYAVFLIIGSVISVMVTPSAGPGLDLLGILISTAFFITSAASEKKEVRHSLKRLMFMPYLRILPMHFIILFWAFSQGPSLLGVFILLKTIADVGMYLLEHYFDKKQSTPIVLNSI